MTDKKAGELLSLPAKKMPPVSHEGYQAAASHNRFEMNVPERLSRFVLRHLARHFVPRLAARKPARFAVVQGEPGEGKTESVRVTCSRAGVDCIVVSAAELTGETENAGPAALARLTDIVHAITEREQRPLAFCFDDFDLSNATRLEHTQYTVNSQVTIAALQHLADAGGMKTAQGAPVPILMTGNDFTNMRSSLLRPGRAVFYEHALSLEEKCDIVSHILGCDDVKGVRSLISAHREPIAFFAELYDRALDDDLDALIANYGLNVETLNSMLRDPGRLDIASWKKLAAQAATGRPRNYLARR